MPRILIAGCGYVGEATADLFHSAGWKVEGWVHSSESAARLSVKPYSIQVIDVSRHADVRKYAGAFDAVIHCVSSRGGDVEAYCQITSRVRAISSKRFRKLKFCLQAAPAYMRSATARG